MVYDYYNNTNIENIYVIFLKKQNKKQKLNKVKQICKINGIILSLFLFEAFTIFQNQRFVNNYELMIEFGSKKPLT